MTEGPKRRTVDARGLPLAVWDWGGPAGAPVVVLHHGFLDHGRSWAPVAEILRERFRVVAPDARGHGASGWVGAGGYYYFQDYVFDLADLVEQLGLEAPVLVGHSMGGMAVSLYAGTFPARIRGLVSIEGWGVPDSAFADAPARMREWIEGVRRVAATPPRPMASVAEAAERLRRYNARLPVERARRLAEQGTRRVDGGVLWAFDPRHRTRLPQPYYRGQARAFWERITAPVLLVTGAESPARHDPEIMRDSVPHAEVAEVADAGHMVHHDRPAAFAELLADFLARLEA